MELGTVTIELGFMMTELGTMIMARDSDYGSRTSD